MRTEVSSGRSTDPPNPTETGRTKRHLIRKTHSCPQTVKHDHERIKEEFEQLKASRVEFERQQTSVEEKLTSERAELETQLNDIVQRESDLAGERRELAATREQLVQETWRTYRNIQEHGKAGELHSVDWVTAS